MLQNKVNLKIQYSTLNSEEKTILRRKCINYIKNKTTTSFYDELCSFDFFCYFNLNNEINDSLLNLMDYLSNKELNYTESIDINDKLIQAVYNNINIPYENYNTEILSGVFIKYLKIHFKYFIDDEILILLLKTYKNEYQQIDFHNNRKDISKSGIIERIPFILENSYRIFFIKLRNIKLTNLGKYLIKCKNREILIDENLQNDLLNNLLQTDFEEFPEIFFT